ncbi:LacI family DNA-binding transcriptional regulator [Tengunoibacter tsumagoiensis]|uniref:LacI family transcriptional regulator n=1 Tax=Tengunoibacter tsumagoiensis TaxID=2014871 RepID=A0A402A631_9CHLR|nr:LacI family DNA-binding transcriptional regulator [Tengunoibacter tsumagoiensis]GCE14604.1 LacI family transcriptional regulator [Tengunoibacter tsumagoiensis]
MRKSAQRNPTQADVAKLAGVSQSTVSLVLGENGSTSVPEETQQRVHEAVRKLHYVPDRMARSLRTRKSYLIASILPDITNPFYPTFQRGIQSIAEQRGYDLISYNTDGIATKERHGLKSFEQNRVDGIILVSFHITAEDLRPLTERNIAIACLKDAEHSFSSLPVDCLSLDDVASSYTAVTHLIERGHRQIGLVNGRFGPASKRLQGYQKALTEAGLPFEPQLIYEDDFTEQCGYKGAQTLLSLPEPPTAIFAANDVLAIGVLTATKAMGLRIPEDVALIGCDDIPIARLLTPPLTTIAQFQENLGKRAAELLFERLNGQAPETGRDEVLPFQLIVREST